MIVIGIDPGLSGALAALDTAKAASCAPAVFPWLGEADALDTLLHLQGEGENDVQAWIEDVPYFAGRDLPASGLCKLHANAGWWRGVLAGLRIRVHLVRPQEWQRGIAGAAGKKGDEKKRALRDEARRRFPDARCTLKTADALLVADHGRRALAMDSHA